MLHIGFTGTAQGMTFDQSTAIRARMELAAKEYGGEVRFHHGDCLGADAQAALLASDLGFTIISHPCNLRAKRAFSAADEVREPKPPLMRNRDIVRESMLMLAAPESEQERRRSGTWATIRYARETKTRLWIVLPGGVVIASTWTRADMPKER